MRTEQFESDGGRERRDRPWRKDASPVNKAPTNPNYPSKPFDFDEWNRNANQNPKRPAVKEDSSEIPEVGDTIRTKKMQMEGKVEGLGQNRAGYDEVTFRIADGRLMKTPLENVIVITKLADDDMAMMEDRVDEISNEVLAKYKKAAGADAAAADKAGNYERGNKRFSGIVQATKKQFNNDAKKTKTEEGSMGGINRSAPAQDVSYEKVLDEVKALWNQTQLEALDPWHGYTSDDPKAGALAKAPNSAVQGTEKFPLDQMIKNNIKTHGVKWAFNFHCIKNGLPPRQFQILAGLVPRNKAATASVPAANPTVPAANNSDYQMVAELSVDRLRAYKDAATSPEVVKTAPLRKIVKHAQGANIAGQKIKTKTGDRTGMSQPDRGAY